MKYLSILLVFAAFSVAGTIPALSRTIHHSTMHLAHGATLAGPLYLYRGWSAVGPGCLSPASLCAGEASQR
jgi:hypothetical protein